MESVPLLYVGFAPNSHSRYIQITVYSVMKFPGRDAGLFMLKTQPRHQGEA